MLIHIIVQQKLTQLYKANSVQFSRSVMSKSVTPWTAAPQASLSITRSWSLLKLTSIESVMPSNHLILCHPLLLLPSIFPSIRVFPSESVLPISWPKYWRFSLSMSPSNEYSGLISVTAWGIDLDYCDIECFALETNRDHSVIFEIASKYCISDSFVDHDGYSSSSEGFLPAVVDIMVI